MIRKLAGWYSILLGAALIALTFVWLDLQTFQTDVTVSLSIGYVASGVFLVGGGLARLMRFPGRVASAFLGFGAGTVALVMAIARLLEIGAPFWQTGCAVAALVLLVLASWSLWPSTS